MALPQPRVQAGLSRVAEALSDPAREAIVGALLGGKAMPAGELAEVAGVSPQSASAHLQKLVDGGLLAVLAQGRFRYYRIAGEDVAALIEGLAELAAKAAGAGRGRRPVADELRQSRSCYSHLAGQLGVLLCDALVRRKFVTIGGRAGEVTASGLLWCRSEDIDFGAARAPHCRLCNDWTERVPHLSGPLPSAIFKHLIATRCLAPRQLPRALRMTPKGRAFFDRLGVTVPF
jgi:DNA-binding transcriptional ArsR family regulator